MEEKRGRRGEVTKLSDLFQVYRERLVAPQGSVVKVLIEVVYDLFHITLKETDCAYTPSSHILKLNVRGPLKTEILLRKKEILTHMKGRLGGKSAPNDIL